jgi:hypothetical protein
MAKRSKAKRTKKGTVTATARKKHGGGKGLKKGSFPVFDAKSARSALRLRGHAKSKKAVVAKVARIASRTKNKALKAAAAKARAKDKKR